MLKRILSVILGLLIGAFIWYWVVDQSPKAAFIAAGVIFVATIAGVVIYGLVLKRRRRKP